MREQENVFFSRTSLRCWSWFLGSSPVPKPTISSSLLSVPWKKWLNVIRTGQHLSQRLAKSTFMASAVSITSHRPLCLSPLFLQFFLWCYTNNLHLSHPRDSPKSRTIHHPLQPCTVLQVPRWGDGKLSSPSFAPSPIASPLDRTVSLLGFHWLPWFFSELCL